MGRETDSDPGQICPGTNRADSSSRFLRFVTVRNIIGGIIALQIGLFLGGVLIINYFQNRASEDIFRSEKQEAAEAFERLVQLKGSGLEIFVRDYTYWDEMVQFFHQQDRKWAEANIAPGLETFGTDAIWCFNLQGDLIYFVADSGYGELESLPGLKEGVFRLLADTAFCHFFLKWENAVTEIRGATVHPTDDPGHLTPAHGIFVAGRVWNSAFLSGLGEIAGGDVFLCDAEELKSFVCYRRDSSSRRRDRLADNAGTGVMVLRRVLSDSRGKPVAVLEMEKVNKGVEVYRGWARHNLAVMLLEGGLIFITLIFALTFFVTTPLRDLVNALDRREAGYLKKWQNRPCEFGKISRAIGRLFSQEEEIRKQKEEAQRYLDIAGVIIVALDEEGRVVLVNRKGCELLGYEAEEIKGKDWFENFLPEAVRAKTRAVFRGLLEGMEAECAFFENPVLTRDGRERLIAWRNAVVRDHTGRIVGTLSSGEDITETRRIERALKENEAKLRTITETMRDGLVMIDDEGRVALMNPAAEQLLGYKSDELLGKVFHEIVAPERYRPLYRKKFPGFARTGTGAAVGKTIELEALRKDGTEVPVELSLSALNWQGRWYGVGVMRDITERRAAEKALAEKAEELRRSNQELERFAYVASHDLQEPLRMVGSYVGLLARRYKGKLDKDADEFINYAVDGVTRMQRLINDLLTYSRVGTRGREPVPTASGEVLKRALLNLKVAIEEKNARITWDEPLPVVMADDRQLEQLFQNLIGNAIKFNCQPVPEVKIGAEKRNGVWVFRVEDNGIGIDPKFSEKVFEIFQRLHTREEYPGTGIGLAVCKKIVERHGGKIWFESEPGKGTTFYFTLYPAEERKEG